MRKLKKANGYDNSIPACYIKGNYWKNTVNKNYIILNIFEYKVIVKELKWFWIEL